MKRTLFIIILISIIALVVSSGSSESKHLDQIVDMQLIMCDEVEMIIGIEGIEEHLLFKLQFTSNYYSEIIDDDYGWLSN